MNFLKKKQHNDNTTDVDVYHHAHAKKKQGALNMRDELVAAVAEFVGTTLFIFFATSGTHNAKMLATSVTGTAQYYRGEGFGPGSSYNTSNLMYISLSTAFSYAIVLWIFYRLTTGLFNPAITFALALAGQLKMARILYLIPAQMLGSIAGAGLANAMLPGDFHSLSVLNAGIKYSRAWALEAFGTALLCLAVLFLATERRRSSHLAHLGIGIAYWIGLLTTTFWTGGSLNPVRAFGPAVIMTSFPGYHWLFWFGPAFGAFMAATFYRFIKLVGADHFAHPDSSYDLDTRHGHHNHNNTRTGDLEQGHNVNAHTTAKKPSFFTRTAARDQSSSYTHGNARDDGCSGVGNYMNRGGIGAGPEHTGLRHSRGDGAVHDNERGGHAGDITNEKTGVHSQDHSDAALTSRLDRIESLLLQRNTQTPHLQQQAYLPVGGRHNVAGRPSNDGTVYEEDIVGAGGANEGHNWKTSKVIA